MVYHVLTFFLHFNILKIEYLFPFILHFTSCEKIWHLLKADCCCFNKQFSPLPTPALDKKWARQRCCHSLWFFAFFSLLYPLPAFLVLSGLYPKIVRQKQGAIALSNSDSQKNEGDLTLQYMQCGISGFLCQYYQ